MFISNEFPGLEIYSNLENGGVGGVRGNPDSHGVC